MSFAEHAKRREKELQWAIDTIEAFEEGRDADNLPEPPESIKERRERRDQLMERYTQYCDVCDEAIMVLDTDGFVYPCGHHIDEAVPEE